MSFKHHIDGIIKKSYGCLSSLYRSINCFLFQVRKRLISQLILPIIDYVDIIYQNTSDTSLKPLNILHNSLCRFVLRCPYRTHHCMLYKALDWLQPNSRRQYHWFQFLFKCIYFNCPSYLKQFLVPSSSTYSLRHMQYPHFLVHRFFTEVGQRSFQYKAPSDWNNLPSSLRSIASFRLFRTNLLSHLKITCLCF